VSAPAVLEIDELVAGYGATRVVQGLSIRVEAGGVTALLGANGAGKTTLMKALAGLVPVSGGRLRLEGIDITRLGGINPRARPHVRRNLDRVYELFPRLLERRSQAAATLSGGEQQMLAIGRGLMAMPRLMLLDEPTLGLAPVMALQIFELVQRLTGEGLTLLLAEQDVQRTLAVARRAYVIENGRVAAEGAAADVGADPRIRRAFMGL
jgi:branched-chain amino acid transport system ATP-binding protein